MELYPKLELIFQFFSQFLKSTSNFEHFEKRDEPPSLFISEL